MSPVAQPDSSQGFSGLFLVSHAVKVLCQHDVLDRR